MCVCVCVLVSECEREREREGERDCFVPLACIRVHIVHLLEIRDYSQVDVVYFTHYTHIIIWVYRSLLYYENVMFGLMHTPLFRASVHSTELTYHLHAYALGGVSMVLNTHIFTTAFLFACLPACFFVAA